jgi:AraC-like DNA-binding protein
LKKRDMLQQKSEPPRGILHLAPDASYPRLERFEAGEALRVFVEHYWAVTWEGQPRQTAETVPHPSVHWIFESGRSALHGVYPRRFSRVLEGSGRVLGVKFRPGGFHTFAKGSIARFTGKIVAASSVFGPSVAGLEADTTVCTRAACAFELVEDYLSQFRPTTTPELLRITEIVGSIVSDHSITQVEMLVERAGLGLRQLQRMFREWVGVSPKWVIRRYRLIEAAERLRGEDASLNFAALTLELGYADQAHFIRDFKALVGMTPAGYHQSLHGRKVSPRE